jgi:hypothetical protein
MGSRTGPPNGEYRTDLPRAVESDVGPETRKQGISVAALRQNGGVDFSRYPSHAHWRERIARGELAINSLLTLAGLVHFARSQQALDKRIESGIAEA